MMRRGLIVAASLLLAAAQANAIIIDRIAAIVNEHVVTESEVQAVQQLDMKLSGLPGNTDPLEERIQHHLIIQQVSKQPPLPVPEDQVQEVIQSYIQQYGGQEEFLVFLHSIGMNYQDFERELREQLTIQSFIALRFRPFVNITLDEAERYYNEVYRVELESKGKEAPAFALSFEEIQARMTEEQVHDRTRAWLDEIRKTASIQVKE